MNTNPIAAITMRSGARIVIELRPDAAPNTVMSFISLAGKGAFDNHRIQRIVPGYVADMSYDAFGKECCKYLIANEAPNGISVEPGVIAMGGYGGDIAGGEFFFPLARSEKLDGHYPAFGIIKSGLDEVLSWGELPLRPVPYPADPSVVVNEPISPLVIERVRVDTFGVVYPEPVKKEMVRRPPSW